MIDVAARPRESALSVYDAFERVHRLALALQVPAPEKDKRRVALEDMYELDRACAVGMAKMNDTEMTEDEAACVRIVSVIVDALFQFNVREVPTAKPVGGPHEKPKEDLIESFLRSARITLEAGTADACEPSIARQASAVCAAFLATEFSAANEMLENPDALIAGYINR
ncbi:hypothetical protein FJY68_10680 [candidate division WOR-3 bacterium]|uniref:Uncharacterized protein n=1 Tax=candidate division WOR-3 bacterium TaxID=2052148 RepID=A0A938BQL6_UNCW3|nr:hypothetical protein [candidate division WOR-3 bacterium]